MEIKKEALVGFLALCFGEKKHMDTHIFYFLQLIYEKKMITDAKQHNLITYFFHFIKCRSAWDFERVFDRCFD
jgi:hypothetical protein